MNVSSAIWYNLAQTGIYAIMAVGVMRLKLFFTPHLCIIAGLLAKRNVSHYKYRSVSHYVLTVCIHVCIVFSFYLDFSLFEIVDVAHDVYFLITIDDEH